jgi:hypothetical protein
VRSLTGLQAPNESDGALDWAHRDVTVNGQQIATSAGTT